MPYKKFHLYLPAGEQLSFEKSIRIFKTFLDGLANNNIEYPNFNNHSEKNNQITFRADMDSPAYQAATRIAKELMENGTIIGYRRAKKNPAIYVKVALELASKFAKEIYDNNFDAFNQEIKRNIIGFMFYFFLKLCLANIDYNLYISWDIERNYLDAENREHRERIESIVYTCEDLIRSNREHFTNPDFIERFIYLFMNCTLIGSLVVKQGATKAGDEVYVLFEPVFWMHFSRINTLQSISNSINVDG